MTNTAQLLADAEKRIQAGDVPDECADIHKQWMVGKCQTKTCLTAAYEAGKREMLRLLAARKIEQEHSCDFEFWTFQICNDEVFADHFAGSFGFDPGIDVEVTMVNTKEIIEYLEQQR